MAEVRIDYKVNDEEVRAARRELEKLKKETGLATGQTEKLNKRYEEMEKQSKETTREMKGFKGQLSGINEGLDEMGPVAQQASAGVKGLSSAFKALLANPVVAVIGAIVGALTLLTKAFFESQAGIDAVAREQARLNAMWKVARDRLNGLTDSLLDAGKKTTGLRNILNDLGSILLLLNPQLISLVNEMKKEGQAAADAADAMGALELETAKNNLTIAKNREEIEKQILITRISEEDREKQREALKEANRLEIENLELKEATLQAEIDLVRQLQGDSKTTQDEQIELLELEIALVNERTAAGARRRELQNREEEQENKFAAQDKQRLANEKERNDERIDMTEDFELTKVESNQRLLEDEEKFAVDLLAIDKELGVARLEGRRLQIEAQEEMERAALETKRELALAEVQLASAVFSAFGQLAEQSAGIQTTLLLFEKAAAIAGVVVSTQQAIGRIPTTILVPGPYGSPISVANPDFPRAVAAQNVLGAAAVAQIVAAAIPEAIAINQDEPTFNVRQFHTGGFVEGQSDEVKALLQTGEFVMQRSAVQKYGLPVLEALNDMQIDGPTVIGPNEVRVSNLNDIAVHQTIMDERGFHRYLATKAGRIEYLNKRNF